MMLKAENLNVYYKKIHAIKDISFEVNEGEVVSLIGANGAGKLLRCTPFRDFCARRREA